MIPDDAIEAICAALRVSEVVSRRVKLKKSGRIWQGLCPFHAEKTPSFKCDDQRGTWHCFGCGEHGNVINFVRQLHGWTFVEAIETLAKEAGVALPQASPAQAKIEARKLGDIEVLERVRLWFEQQLANTPDAQAYLRMRGVSDGEIDTFGIGFSPAHVKSLAHSVGGQFDDDVLSRCGLVGVEGGAFLKDRIAFPIRDGRGRTIGFGGRALTAQPPKYLNTPETELFHKGSVLYGSDLARQPAHDGNPLLVVEGYLDVIACHQVGIPAVAPMGTSLTESQLLSLWRLSDRPIVCFDGDEAGRKATRRALELAFKHLQPGITVQVCKLPQGRDPASYLYPSTPDRFKRILERPASLSEAFWQASTEGQIISGPDRLAKLESNMVEVLNTIPNRQLRDKYVWDCKQRVRTLAKPKRIIRANGFSFHSTNPASKRLLAQPDTMTIKQALEIVGNSQADPNALDEAQSLLSGVGLWPTNA